MKAAGWLVSSTTAPLAPLSLGEGVALGDGAGVGDALGEGLGEGLGDGLDEGSAAKAAEAISSMRTNARAPDRVMAESTPSAPCLSLNYAGAPGARKFHFDFRAPYFA
jgi:hypothetical protein